MEKFKKIAVLVLAAGSSSRFGEAKQLAKYQDETLIKIVVKKALSLNLDVCVVLGHETSRIKKELKEFDILFAENKEYKKGIGTSISIGVNKLKEYGKILIMLCDQPFVPITHLESLIRNSENSEKIVCSFYKNSVAVPAIFTKIFYEELINLDEDKGAKNIIKNSNHLIIPLEEEFAFDIDTKEDLKKLDHLIN